MTLDIKDPLNQIKITQSVCGFVAICMTVHRLYIRRGRYWWDDAWAFFSLINLVIQFVSVFMHIHDTRSETQTFRVAAYYLMAVTFYMIIWSARLSILFSIIRLEPDPVVVRRLKWIGGIFIGAIFFFFAQLMWVCEPKTGWKQEADPQCTLNKEVAICQVVSDVVADLLLITLPLRLLHGIRDRGLRRRLMIIFSTSIVTTIVSLVHAAYIITDGGIRVVISALVEDCMSLTVANLPVSATALFRYFGVYASSSDEDTTSVAPTTMAKGDGPRFNKSARSKTTTFGFAKSIWSKADVGDATTRFTTNYGYGVGMGPTTTHGSESESDATKTVKRVSHGPAGLRTIGFALGPRGEGDEDAFGMNTKWSTEITSSDPLVQHFPSTPSPGLPPPALSRPSRPPTPTESEREREAAVESHTRSSSRSTVHSRGLMHFPSLPWERRHGTPEPEGDRDPEGIVISTETVIQRD